MQLFNEIIEKEKNILLFLDGFDEVINKPSLVKEIKKLSKNKKIRIVITSRPNDVIFSFLFPIFYMAPLSTGEVVKIASLYVRDSNKDQLEKFYGSFGAFGTIQEWANPMYIWMFCIVLNNVGEEAWKYPKGKVIQILLEDLFLKRYDFPKRISQANFNKFTLNYKLSALCNLAYSMLSGSDKYHINTLSVAENFKSFFGIHLQTSHSLIESLLLHNLIDEKFGNISLLHKTFRNYFAAKYLTIKISDTYSELQQLSNKEYWHEPIVILSGLVEFPEKLILNLLEKVPDLYFEYIFREIDEKFKIKILSKYISSLIGTLKNSQIDTKNKVKPSINLQRISLIYPNEVAIAIDLHVCSSIFNENEYNKADSSIHCDFKKELDLKLRII